MRQRVGTTRLLSVRGTHYSAPALSRLSANLLLLLTGAIWGMGFVAQSSAMAAIGPWTYVAVRYVLAAVSVLPFALAEILSAPRALTRRERRGFILIGVLLFAGSILQQVGMLTTSVTNAGFLTGLYVVFTPFLALLLLRTMPHWVVWPAAVAAFVGTVLIGGGTLRTLSSGDFWVIGCAVFWSLQIIFVGLFAAESGRPFTLSLVQFAVSALLGSIGAVLTESVTAARLWAAAPQLVFGGVFSAGLAFTLQTLAQRWTTAPQAAIFLSSEALFAALFGAILLGERIPPIGYLGCGLIFAAMLAVELIPMRAEKVRLTV